MWEWHILWWHMICVHSRCGDNTYIHNDSNWYTSKHCTANTWIGFFASLMLPHIFALFSLYAQRLVKMEWQWSISPIYIRSYFEDHFTALCVSRTNQKINKSKTKQKRSSKCVRNGIKQCEGQAFSGDQFFEHVNRWFVALWPYRTPWISFIQRRMLFVNWTAFCTDQQLESILSSDGLRNISYLSAYRRLVGQTNLNWPINSVCVHADCGNACSCCSWPDDNFLMCCVYSIGRRSSANH